MKAINIRACRYPLRCFKAAAQPRAQDQVSAATLTLLPLFMMMKCFV